VVAGPRDPAPDYRATVTAAVLDLDTPHGPARAHVTHADAPRLAIVLGHGAGGGVQAPDLLAAEQAALASGASVALVEQPYRVAGRRSAAPAKQLDAAWVAVVEQLAAGPFKGLRHVSGGRSSGARVACRTAAATGAVAVLCLAFPLVPPRRRTATGPPATRQDELDAVTVPVLVVQGENDRFGMPENGANRTVVRVRGDHRLASDREGVRTAVARWLAGLPG
jgi:predicted alpha/beta-hydrolase family hydrolase